MVHVPAVNDKCAWEVSRGVECGEPAIDTVLLRDNRLGSARVKVCSTHKAEYNRKAALHRATK